MNVKHLTLCALIIMCTIGCVSANETTANGYVMLAAENFTAAEQLNVFSMERVVYLLNANYWMQMANLEYGCYKMPSPTPTPIPTIEPYIVPTTEPTVEVTKVIENVKVDPAFTLTEFTHEGNSYVGVVTNNGQTTQDVVIVIDQYDGSGGFIKGESATYTLDGGSYVKFELPKHGSANHIMMNVRKP